MFNTANNGSTTTRNPQQCCQNIGASTKMIMGVIVLSCILSVFHTSVKLLQLCPSAVFHGQIWRIFTSIFITESILRSLFALLTIYQYGTILGVLSGVTWFQTFCYSDVWPVCFVLITVETQLAEMPQRRFMCFPCNVPTKQYPLLLLCFFSIFFIGRAYVIFMMAIGCVVGYMYVKSGWLKPTAAKLAEWDRSSKWSWLANQNGFITSDGAAGFSVGGGGDGGGGGGGGAPTSSSSSGRGTWGSGVSGSRGNIVGLGSSSTPQQQSNDTPATQMSVFSTGQGHTLGGGSRRQQPPRPGQALVERLEQEKRRKQQQQQGSSSATVRAPKQSSPEAPVEVVSEEPIRVNLDHVMKPATATLSNINVSRSSSSNTNNVVTVPIDIGSDDDENDVVVEVEEDLLPSVAQYSTEQPQSLPEEESDEDVPLLFNR